MIYTHTNLNTYDICPKQYHHRYVLKDLPKQVQTKEQTWGNDVHKAFESRINKGTPFPKEMEAYERYTDFGRYMVKAEVKLGILDNGVPCDFFADNVWLRGVLDVVIDHRAGLGTAMLLDWKTGKRREDPAELELHAVLLRAHRPKLEKIVGHYVWLKDGEIGQAHDLSDTITKLDSIGEKINEIEYRLNRGYMPPKQGPLCPWCPVKSCEFHPDKT